MSVIESLRKNKNDRGILANLRCVLIENKRHRAYPALHRLGVDITDLVSAHIAGLYATHPEETSTGNIGNTCKAIEKADGKSRDEKLSPTERKFQYLLSASRDEIFDRITRVILMAKSQGIPVNYGQLEKDLRFWSERTKTEWASEFWSKATGGAAA